MFKGSIPALITPFANGEIDEAALRALISWHIDAGSHGIVPTGTTGESPTLSHEEHKRVVEICVEEAKGLIPVIAGTGSNSTAEAVEWSQHAKSAGADAVLVVTPYYNKPTQEGLFAHFKAIDRAVDIPILIYNIPGRSVVDMHVDTMARLYEACPHISGVKDATADLARASLQRHVMGKGFYQLSGEDATALGFMAHGGHGCISVTANVAPNLCARFQNACLQKDFAEALLIQDRLIPLHTALFIESSPAPAKYAVSLLGKCTEEVRQPLAPITESTRTAVRDAMIHAGILN